MSYIIRNEEYEGKHEQCIKHKSFKVIFSYFFFSYFYISKYVFIHRITTLRRLILGDLTFSLKDTVLSDLARFLAPGFSPHPPHETVISEMSALWKSSIIHTIYLGEACCIQLETRRPRF